MLRFLEQLSKLSKALNLLVLAFQFLSPNIKSESLWQKPRLVGLF
jgi:hypothetical protein